MTFGGRKEAAYPFLEKCVFGDPQMRNFSPFSIKIQTYILFGGVAMGQRPIA